MVSSGEARQGGAALRRDGCEAGGEGEEAAAGGGVSPRPRIRTDPVVVDGGTTAGSPEHPERVQELAVLGEGELGVAPGGHPLVRAGREGCTHDRACGLAPTTGAPMERCRHEGGDRDGAVREVDRMVGGRGRGESGSGLTAANEIPPRPRRAAAAAAAVPTSSPRCACPPTRTSEDTATAYGGSDSGGGGGGMDGSP